VIYEQKVQPKLSAEDQGKFAAIDVDSGIYEMDPDEMTACDRLRRHVPDAQIWLVRIGSSYLHRFGGRILRDARRLPALSTTGRPAFY
jgi:hypothetical protein